MPLAACCATALPAYMTVPAHSGAHAAHVSCLQYKFTATPLNGGKPAIAASATPVATFTGLTPATQVGVWKLFWPHACGCLPANMLASASAVGQATSCFCTVAAAVRGIRDWPPEHRHLDQGVQHP